MAKTELLVDTSYVVALLHKRDQYHETAQKLADRFEARAKLVITQAVCLEIGSFLADLPNRSNAVQMLNGIRSDPAWRSFDERQPLFRGPHALHERPDKEWSLIDCVSFVVMNERGITDALTADGHFEQAGFRPLMREAA